MFEMLRFFGSSIRRGRSLIPRRDDAGGGGGAGGGEGGGGGSGSVTGGEGGGGGGGGGNAFLETLPEEYRADPAFKDIADLPNLAKSYLHAQKLVGADTVAIPGESATAEERGQFYNRLGRPEKADGYEFADDGLPKDLPGRENILNGVRAVMHEVGLTKGQAETIYKKYGEILSTEATTFTENHAKEQAERVEAVKKEMGAAYEQNLTIAKRAVALFDNENKELAALLDESGLGNHPAIVRAFTNIGKKLVGDKIISGDGAGGDFALTPEEAKAKISKLHGDEKWLKAFMDKANPDHQRVQDENTYLHKLAWPDQK